MKKKPRLILESANLSAHPTKWIKTGIQEVIYQTLLATTTLREEFPDIEILLLPKMIQKFKIRSQNNILIPFENPIPDLLETIEEQVRLPSKDIWGFDLKKNHYQVSDQEVLQYLMSADFLHFQSLINVGPLLTDLQAKGTLGALNAGITLYDLSPVLFPEFCDPNIAKWFQSDYLVGVSQSIHRALCISHHTARDVRDHPLTRKIPNILAIPLPIAGTSFCYPTDRSELLQKYRLQPKNFLIFLGSLEPRKNFDDLLTGFEHYKRLYPQSPLKLVLIGSTGWENNPIEKRLNHSPCFNWITRIQYLQDSEVYLLMKQALALMMVSYYEGFGLPLAQATHLQLPVITTLGSSLPEACGGKGIFVEPDDPWSICAGIQIAQHTKIQWPSENSDTSAWTWKHYTHALIHYTLASTTSNSKIETNA